jgi:putative PIN family toxin of toxin-antitoxin system
LATQFDGVDAVPFLELLLNESDVVYAAQLKKQICEDPDDDKFLAAAIAGGAKVIVSGDHHLLKVSGYEKIEVLKPREFLDRIRFP